jgi:catechol 2,3-dioxygenase-like lactoylglutathione lyase family enzyme
MSTTQGGTARATGKGTGDSIDMKLEVAVIPVSDVNRAKEFYGGLGWRVDADVTVGDLQLLQFTPPGSDCSIQFGTNLTPAPPGSTQNTYLVVSDIEAARKDLLDRGVAVSGIFHEGTLGDRFAPDGSAGRVEGSAPGNKTYSSFASFDDPDGNRWLLQEITARLPGRIDSAVTTFASVSDLADAMRRASAAHGEHEKRIGAADPNWPDWYAAYMVAEQAGDDLPT